MDQSPPTYRFRPPIAPTRRRQPPSEPTIFIFFLVILSLLLLFFFFFLLPLLSHAPKIIKPTPVKVKSNWNSLIVFLFLFAIIAGVLAQNNDVPSTPNITNRVNNRASESNRNRDQEVQVNGDLRRSSSSSSNPVLRQKPLPENGGNNHSRRREGRKENIHRSEPVSGDIRHRSRRSEARKVVPNVPEIMVQRQSPIRSRPPPPPVARAPAAPVSGESRRRPESTHKPPSPPSQPSEPLRRRPESTHKPPLPTKASNYYHDRDDFHSSSSQSSSSIPLPPPPLPFKLPPRIVELHGHYVRLRSVHSSDFSSPDRDDLRSTIIDGGDLFGPSPISSTSTSLNAKADRFISKNKDEWKTERRKKRNS